MVSGSKLPIQPLIQPKIFEDDETLLKIENMKKIFKYYNFRLTY